MPVMIFIYIIGKTIMKAINADKWAESSQISTSTTKEANGTDFITDMSGETKKLMYLLHPDNTASREAAATAKKNPDKTRTAEKSTEPQKSFKNNSSNNLLRTLTGDGSNMSYPIKYDAACHTASQNIRAKNRAAIVLSRCFGALFLCCSVVEVIFRQFSAYCGRILLIESNKII